MPKYIVVEIPEYVTTVALEYYKTEEGWTRRTATILHGKRALLEKVLEVGGFGASNKHPKRGECYFDVGRGKLILAQSWSDDMEHWCPVLTNLDEEVYCHECSVAGSEIFPIYHKPPACTKPDEPEVDEWEKLRVRVRESGLWSED